ncbi:MAG: polysaccharide pyruvyl transferase family protein [Propionibacteriaceae bacterium]|nr:polysaccharide pyruvyl transferase family protein [Propionibacteriaceae bacterium]
MGGERILIRAGKDPRTVLSPEAALAYHPHSSFGTNIGNALFSDSVWRLLSVPQAELTADAFSLERVSSGRNWAEFVNDHYDRYVLPMANAFRRGAATWLDRLSGIIERLTIPVTVVGVGANLHRDGSPGFDSAMAESVARFMRAVLEHSALVGVRGEMTATYLKTLGFSEEHVQVIGCPSVYLNGPDYSVTRRTDEINTDSPLSLCIAPPEAFFAGSVAYHVATYPRLIYVPQETSDLAMMVWGVNRADRVYAEEMPATTSHVLFQQDRMRFPLDSSVWVDMLRPMHVSFGTRIHGVIAGLLAGVPGFTVPFGSRILELSRYHEIPTIARKKVTAGFDIATEYESGDWSAYNAGLKPRFEVLTRFLETNGLTHIYQEGQDNPAFDAEIAATRYPPPVHPLVEASPTFDQDRSSRLAWLQQGEMGDLSENEFVYHPPFLVSADIDDVAQETSQTVSVTKSCQDPSTVGLLNRSV